MKLDGFGLMVSHMKTMVNFYKNVLGFDIDWQPDEKNVYLIKDGTVFMLYGRSDFEEMTHRKYAYVGGLNGHSEIALSVPTYCDVDKEFARVTDLGATAILPPETEPWGQRTCYIADPEGNIIEIASFVKE